MTIYQTIQDYLAATAEEIIPLQQLLAYTSEVTGYTTESVRGSSLGLARDKVLKQPWFRNKWVYLPRTIGKPACIMRKYLVDANKNANYTTQEKQQAREFTFRGIESRKNPVVLTLAGECGYDVRYVLSLNLGVKIHNVERDSEVLKAYQRHHYPTHDYCCDLHTFLLEDDGTHFDYLNYDSLSYLCESIANDLILIDDFRMADVLSLTLMNIRKIRNHGKFADYAREWYGCYNDPTLHYIKDILSNYTFSCEYQYQRMRVLKFYLRR